MKQVKVTWFNVLKGIGEGETLKGEIVFINSLAVITKGVFKGLIPGETVLAELKQDKDFGLYTYKIKKLAQTKGLI